MALIGQKGTYAQVQAPKDYLGNALSNIERNNFLYREEKRRQDELEQAQRESAEKEQMARTDKAYEEAGKLKAENSGNNRLNLSMQKFITEKANRYAELKQKRSLSIEEREELNSIPKLVDNLKMTAQNVKSSLDTWNKEMADDNVNMEILGKNGDILESIYNLPKGEFKWDNNGNMSVELVDPTTNEKTLMPIEKFGDPTYIASLMPRKQKIMGKDGLVDVLKANLQPEVNEVYKNGQIVTTSEITPLQKANAMEVMESYVSNDMKLKDAAQQLGLGYSWSTNEEKENLKNKVKETLLNQAIGAEKIGTKVKPDYVGQSLAETKKQHAITNARENAKTSGSTTQQSPLSTTVPKTGVNAYNIKVAKGDTQSAVIKAKGKGSLIDTVVFQPRANGKSDFVLGGYQTPKASMLTPKGKEVLANEGAEALDDSHYLDAGKDRFRKISYKQTPELFLAELRKLESLEGGNYTSMEQFKKEMFPNAMPKTTQSAPKAKATSKKTKAIQFDKDGNIIM